MKLNLFHLFQIGMFGSMEDYGGRVNCSLRELMHQQQYLDTRYRCRIVFGPGSDADPHTPNADPDPASELNADPDPGDEMNADPHDWVRGKYGLH